MDDAQDGEVDVAGERCRLTAIAYRMLGTTGEAEDAVQETYLRWYRMSDAERAAILNPPAWLTRVLSRVCLDLLTSARARRETYAGEWLPEPLPAGHSAAASSASFAAFGSVTAAAPEDPLDRVTLDEAVSSALLVVLETMTPPERVAFVLHDAFGVPFPEIAAIVGRSPAAVRQLAASARRRVQQGRPRPVPRAEHDRVVAAFSAAAQAGDLAGLMALLDPAVTLRSDGGGFVSAARKPVRGPDHVARFVLGALVKHTETVVDEVHTADGLAFVMREHGAVVGIVNLRVAVGGITDIWMMLNPRKLLQWHA